MASQAAFNLCVKRLNGAMERLQTLALMPNGQGLIKALSEAEVILKDPNLDVNTLKTDRIFDLCAKVMKETKAFNDVAEATEFAVAVKALEDRYATAAGLMAQWQDPEDDPCHFFLKMEKLAADSGKLNWRTLDLAHDLLNDVFIAVNFAKMNAAESKCARPYKGWQVDRDGQPARFAEAFRTTPVCMAYEVWLGERPVATANYRDIKSWIDRGFKLKDQLEAPWGMCGCGKYKLLPWNDKGVWKPNSLCRECYKAKKGGKISGQKGQDGERSSNVISAETIAALEDDLAFVGVKVETRQTTILGGSSVGKPDDLSDSDADGVVAKPAGRVQVNQADVDEDALVAHIVPIRKKNSSTRKPKTGKVQKVASEPKTPRTSKTKTPAKVKNAHPAEALDATLS